MVHPEWISDGKRTWNGPRSLGASQGRIPPGSVRRPSTAGSTRSAPWAPAIITWKSRLPARKISSTEGLARVFGITIPDQVVVMFHCGSRGFGHQVATDYLQVFLKVMESKYGIRILDRELACAPFDSPEGQNYFTAMKCGINMSFANRQVILHRIREVFFRCIRPLPGRTGDAYGL